MKEAKDVTPTYAQDILTPCKCNGKGIINVVKFRINYPTDNTASGDTVDMCQAMCDFCNAQTPFSFNREKAIAAWNAMMVTLK